jgi:hypothetical protein
MIGMDPSAVVEGDEWLGYAVGVQAFVVGPIKVCGDVPAPHVEEFSANAADEAPRRAVEELLVGVGKAGHDFRVLRE